LERWRNVEQARIARASHHAAPVAVAMRISLRSIMVWLGGISRIVMTMDRTAHPIKWRCLVDIAR